MTNSELSHHDAAYKSVNIGTSGSSLGADLLDSGMGLKKFRMTSPLGSKGQSNSGAKTSHGIGFVPRSELFHRTYNAAIGLFLVLMALPLGVVIAVLLLVTQGRPIFYRGARIGRGGKNFNILKFRTLDSKKAAELTRDRPLEPGTGAETPVGLFLRETRLDELPQLLNVLLGDMNLCGPRPVRPEILSLHEADIPNYGARFHVKPGLIGPTQALMYHGTSKTIRSRLNYRFCNEKVSYRTEIALIATVGLCVFARTLSRSAKVVSSATDEMRSAAEQRAADYKLRLIDANGGSTAVRWIDMDNIALETATDANRPVEGRLEMTLLNGQKRHFDIEIGQCASVAHGGTTGFNYAPKSDFGGHIKSRYLFQKVVVPHQSEFLFAGISGKLQRLLSSRS